MGEFGGFGEGDGYVLDLARKAVAEGFKVGGKTFAVTIIDQDTQSDPARAGQLAKDLINNQGIDMMLTTSTPEVVNPVADACEAAGVPIGVTLSGLGMLVATAILALIWVDRRRRS